MEIHFLSNPNRILGLALIILTTATGFLLPVSTIQAYQQGAGDNGFEAPYGTWQIFTSHRTVRAVESLGNSGSDAIVMSTGGFYLVRSGSATLFNTGDGKYLAEASAIVPDSEADHIWFGYPDGTLSRFSLETSRFRHFNDIERNDRFLSNRINDMRLVGRILYIATDFGVVLFDTDAQIVVDSYVQLGRLASDTKVTSIDIRDGVIYAGTEFGVVIGNPSAGDLKIADNWQTFDQQNGFVSREVRAIGNIDGRLYASADGQNYRFENGNWQVITLFGSQEIVKMRSLGGSSWLIATSSALFEYDADSRTSQNISHDGGTLIINDALSAGNLIFVATERSGLGVLDRAASTFESFEPNAPSHNLFEQFTISASGELIGTASATPGQLFIGFLDTGFYIFRDGIWENFNNNTSDTLKQLNLHSFFRTTTLGDQYFFGLWGGGVVRYNRSDGSLMRYNALNSALRGLVTSPNFYVSIGLTADRANRNYVWSVAWLNDVNPLGRYDMDSGEWEIYPAAQNIGTGSFYRDIFSDSYGQLWIPLTTANLIGRGILVLGNPAGGEGQQYRLTGAEESGNLPNERVHAIVQDRRGEVWVGTERGIARYIFPDRILTGTASERRAQPLINEDTTAFDRVLLRDLYVTAMAVDANNQKWVGSLADGVYLVEETGRRVIHHFTMNNSPLTSNHIKSISVQPKTGEVYIITANGVAIYNALEREGVEKMRELRIYPSPYSYQRHAGWPVVIEELQDDSTVHILTVDGRLVRRFNTRGGRTEWDGLDFNGNRVSSGVYLFVATARNGDQVGRGKLVIIR